MPTRRALMTTLTGPTPAPFTGDRATAQQFVDEFNQLVRANLRHLLVTRPELRVELALQVSDSGLTDETVWDNFYDSFCTAWTDDPVPFPATAIPPPRPPRSPRRPFSPRLASPSAAPTASILDLVKPVDELTAPPVVTSAPPRAADLDLGTTNTSDTALLSPPTDLSSTNNWALFAPRAERPPFAIPAASPSVVEDDNNPGGGVKPSLPRPHRHAATTRLVTQYDAADRAHVRRARHHLDHPPDSRIMKNTRRIVATKHRNQSAWHWPRDHDPDAMRKRRIRHALTDEERDWYLVEGCTENRAPAHHGSALTPLASAEVRPRSPRYADIFPQNALEMPRDPDEVAPATPQHEEVARNLDRPAHAAQPTSQQRLRATAAEFVPSPPDTVRQPTTAPLAMTRSRAESTHVRPRRHSRNHAATTAPRPTTPVAMHGRNRPTQINGVRLALQRRTPAVGSHLARAVTRIRETSAPAAPPVTARRRSHTDAAGTTSRPPNANTEATRNRDRLTRESTTRRHVPASVPPDRVYCSNSPERGDPELREYGYDYDYPDARREGQQNHSRTNEPRRDLFSALHPVLELYKSAVVYTVFSILVF
ncbi:hypothetical protein EDB85DRAFT_1895590 [Lactarius pseudohatsudake]|nr:hypothetical protein EDB85DRAFT_1895590 [Lactarius pseudohatsudake]